LLNSELNHAIASMGHGDLMIVCDAGFPIPSSVWRIDLAIVQDVPDLETVLSAVAENFIAEKVSYADNLPTNNQPVLEKVKRLFPDADHEMIPHATILGEMAAKAKVIVRLAPLIPGSTFCSTAGLTCRSGFSKPGVVAPDYYAKKMGK